MKMKMKIFFVLLLLSSNIFAAPAAPGVKNFFQADGTSFLAELKGDEYFSWVVDSLGRVIQLNPSSSNYEYTVIQETNGSLSLGFSGILASNNTPLFASAFSNTEVGIINNLKLQIVYKQYRDNGLQDAGRDSERRDVDTSGITTSD
jgi:hypothetical protein